MIDWVIIGWNELQPFKYLYTESENLRNNSNFMRLGLPSICRTRWRGTTIYFYHFNFNPPSRTVTLIAMIDYHKYLYFVIWWMGVRKVIKIQNKSKSRACLSWRALVGGNLINFQYHFLFALRLAFPSVHYVEIVGDEDANTQIPLSHQYQAI